MLKSRDIATTIQSGFFSPLNDAGWHDEKMKKETSQTSSHFTEGSHSHRD